MTPGKKADIVIINSNNHKAQPIYDPQFTVVFNTSYNDIIMVMINGNILLEDGKLKFDDGSLHKDLSEYNRNKKMTLHNSYPVFFENLNILKKVL